MHDKSIIFLPQRNPRFNIFILAGGGGGDKFINLILHGGLLETVKRMHACGQNRRQIPNVNLLEPGYTEY